MKKFDKMKRSLALLGHSKLKGALRHTLLLMGCVLMSLGAYAQEPTNGLYMHKTWIADTTDPTGSKGEIMLETFVTGEKIKTEAHIPTDIVVVLDQSGSMAYNFDGTQTQNVPIADQRVTALKTALNLFLDSIQADAKRYDIDHRVAIVGFANDNSTTQSGGRWNNTELLSTAEAQAYAVGNTTTTRLTAAMYQDALQYVNVNDAINPRLTTAVTRVAAQGGTMMQYGLIMANGVLSNRTITQYNAGTEEKPNWIDRTQVVVFFTDGYPGMNNPNNRFAQYNPDYYNANTLYICQTTADATVREARTLKNNGAMVFSVGVFEGANPAAAYTTQRKNQSTGGYFSQVQYYYWEPQNLPSGQDSGDAAANGMMHFISSNYSASETPGDTPWTNLTTSTNNVAGYKNNGKYLSASSASELANIFESIAQESGGAAVDLGAGTVVQDVISPSFQLNIPTGSTPGATIRAYAPKCNGKVGGVFTFEDPTDGATRMTLGTVDGVEGMVIGNDENRLADGIVDYDSINKTLTFSNFNFKAMYVAQEVDDDGNPVLDDDDNPIFFGRKLQMFIPLEVDGGSWGDGIATNGPLSVIQPNGDTINTLPFNIPTANVLGSVWTEVIVQKPDGFDANNIDSPEDLAWFISEVNGRIGYNVKNGYNSNNVASHPKLNGRLTADIDMSAHNWVPIGSGWQVEIDPETNLTRFKTNGEEKVHMTYEGTFDGNGHVITGLKNNASKFYKVIEGGGNAGVVVFPGMFSDVSGTVKNVFVLDADFRGKHHNEFFVHHGIIADTLEAGGNIFNCEAAGRITCNNDDVANDSQLIYGGLVGLNKGGTIHSSMAMAELTAYTMGGLVGENRGTVTNSFTNGVYNYLDNGVTPAKYVGGLVGDNRQSTKLENCYVRFERDNKNLNKAVFGQITGTANTTYTKCYSPEDLAGKVPTGSTPGTNTYKHAEPAQWIRPFYHDATLGDTRTALLDQLNADKGSGASWKRTTAGGYLRSPNGGNINGDYPVLAFDAFGEEQVTCLGSADGIRIDYATSLLDMLHRHNNGNMNENTQISNEYTDHNANYYKVTEHEAIYKGTINLYRNDDVRIEEPSGKAAVADNCTADSVVVYVDENVSLLQDDNSVIKGFTGQNMKVFGGDYTDYLSGNRWHNVSSSLENSGFGWTYTNTGQVPHSTIANPCGWRLDQTNDDVDIFPTDLGTYHQTDFYCFYEPQYHWINFRRNGQSHWHMDLIDDAVGYDVPTNHAHINYVNELGVQDNETQFIPGKGYLLAINPLVFDSVQRKETQWLQNYGTLNHTDITIPVSYTADNEWTGLAGYNLLGNPYQSFLDFDAFVEENTALWNGETYAQTYAVYDPSADAYVQYKSTSSNGSKSADQYLNMHQGFFIRISQTGKSAKFTNAMRSNEGTPNFRGSERPNYPLINFELSDGSNGKEIAVLEIGRPENDGAEKLRMASAKGHISLRHDNQDFAILFRDMTKGSQPLYFDAEEGGTFTLSWNTANANFQSLTLVDNIAGVKYDMLAHDSYRFEGRTSDYRSRFKVVIGEFTGIDEEDGPSTGSGTFAFFDGSEWVVNGQGQLDVVDMLGRTMLSERLTSDQSRVSLDGIAQGVYLMRVTNGNEVKVQKIVVR